MRRRRSVPVMLGAVCALAAAGVAAAATVTPPAGTPDLSSMVLQVSDLGAASTVAAQGYFAPVKDFSAEYVTDFANASTTDGVQYFSLQDGVMFAPDTATPGAFLKYETAYFNSRKGRKQFTRTIIRASGKKAHLKPSGIKYAFPGSIGVGDSSAVELLHVATKHFFFDEAIVLFTEGPVYGSLVIEGAVNQKVPTSDIVALATATDSHIKAVLASTGATGASGTTGATG